MSRNTEAIAQALAENMAKPLSIETPELDTRREGVTFFVIETPLGTFRVDVAEVTGADDA